MRPASVVLVLVKLAECCFFEGKLKAVLQAATQGDLAESLTSAASFRSDRGQMDDARADALLAISQHARMSTIHRDQFGSAQSTRWTSSECRLSAHQINVQNTRR